MRQTFTLLIAMFLSVILNAQNVPELIYYKFDGTGTTVPNQASSPVGTNPAPLTGVTQGTGGQFGNGLLGTAVANNFVSTGWGINLGASSWSISMWLSGVPLTTATQYFFGDNTAPASFRCFTGGVAGSGGLLLRSPYGTTGDVQLNSLFGAGPVVVTYVYDNTLSNIKAYVNGVLSSTVAQTPVAFNSTGPFTVGGYSGSGSLPAGAVMDEFRFYNRALSATEVSIIWNQTLPFAQGPIDAALSALVDPNLVAGGCFTSTQAVRVNVTNYGSDTLDFAVDPLIVTAQVTGPNPQTFIDTLTSGTILPGATLLVPLTSSYNMTGAGTFTFQNWVRFVTPGVDANPNNDTLDVSLATGISGNYTINAALPTGGANFQSFSALASVLNTAGICGPITVDVVAGSGPYTDQFLLGQIPGVSATSPITIHGHNNTIQFLSTNTNDRATVRYNGTDYVSLDSLTIVALGQTTTEYGWGVFLTNNADFNTFNACKFLVSTSSTSTNYTAFVTSASASSAVTTGLAASNLTVTNCLAEGGYYGMVINGPTAAPFTENNLITGNTVRDFYLYGMYIRANNNSQISRNEIYRLNRGTISTSYMLYLNGNLTGTIISRNNIHNIAGIASGTSIAYGIYSTGVTATSGQELLISNNLISGYQGMDGANYGLYLLTTDGARVYHNSVALDNVTSASNIMRAFYHTGANAVVDVRNNIFAITGNSAGAKHVIYFGTNTAVITSNFNVLYNGATSGTNSLGFLTSAYATLTDWQINTLLDPGSTSQNPGFVNSAIGDLTPTNVGLNGIVFPLPQVAVDFFGVARGSTPDPGAIEFTPAANDLSMYDILAPTTPACAYTSTEPATIRFINRGFSPVNLAQVQAKVFSVGPGNTGPYTEILPAGVLAAGDTFTYTFVNTLNLATTGNYSVYAEVGFTPASGLTDATPLNNKDTLQIVPGTAGAYTINSALPTAGTNFSSFTAMVNSFTASGLCGPVTVTVAPGSGPYTEQVSIGAISGMSATNTITILGNGNTLKYLSVNAGARHTLKLDGATYVTVDSLVIVSEGQTTTEYGWAVWLTNNADFNTFNACQFLVTKNSTSTNFTPFVTSSSSTGATTTGVAASNLTVTNCIAEGGYYSMVVNGPTTAPFSTNSVITGNQFRDFYLYGLYVRGQNNATISGNEVYRTDRATISTTYCIYLTSDMSGSVINGNKIYAVAGSVATTTASFYGFYGATLNANVGQEILFSNNLISGLTRMNGLQYGFAFFTANQVKVYHNSVSMDNLTHPGTSVIRAFYHTGSAGGTVDVQNNLFAVTTNSTGAKHCLYFGTATAAISSNYNVLYMGTIAGSGNDIAFLGATFPTLAAWQAGGTYDQASEDLNPFLVNLSGVLIPTSSAINNICLPLAVVPADFNGLVRSTTTPDPGAIEFAPLTTDLGVESFRNLTSGCGLSDSTEVVVSVRNFGVDTVFSFQATYQLGALTVTETVNDTLLPGTASAYAFAATVDFSVPATYVLSAWTTATGDLNTFNDSTIGYSVTTYPSFSALPYNQSFDAWTTSPGTSPGAPVIALPDNWVNVQNDGQDWAVYTGPTSTTGTGPDFDHTTGSGKYLYVEDTGFAGDSVFALTPCFDVSAYTATMFSFWYHSNNGVQPNTENFLHVDLLWNGSLLLDIINPIGHKNNSWNFVEIDMSPYIGTFAVRFRVDNSTGGSHDIAIDDIKLREVPPIDVGVADLYNPNSGCGLGAAELVQFGVENFGLDTVRGGYVVNYQITGPLVASGNIAVGDTLAPGDQALVTLPGTFNFSAPGDYTLTLWTTGPAGEGNTANDTLVVVVTSIPLVSAFPYAENFEAGNGGWRVDPASTASTWAFGTPAKSVINSASSGVNAWVTGGLTTGTYSADENSQILGPCFNFSGLNSPVLELDVWWQAEFSWDGANFQTSIDNGTTWQTVGAVGDPDNWYTDGSINGNPGGVQIGWSGRNAANGSQGWRTAKHDLTGLAGQSAVLVRVAFGADGSIQDNGFAFDNITIYDRASDDVGATALVEPGNVACSTDSLPIIVTLTNFGTDTQVTVPVFVNFTSGPLALPQISGVFSGSLVPAASTSFLVGYMNALTPGIYGYQVFTGLAGDTLNGNDTLFSSVDVRQTPLAPAVVNAEVCPTDSAQFTLLASNAPYAISWYDTAVGGTPIFVGDTFLTPYLTSNTTYYAEAGNSIPYTVGPLNNGIGTGAGYTAYADGLVFTVFSQMKLNTVKVYPQGTGTITVRLLNAALAVVETSTFTISSTVTDTVLTLDWIIDPGVGYRMDAVGTAIAGGLYRNSAGGAYPFTVPGVMSITNPINNLAGFYYFYYDWHISSVGCQSPRVPVTATFNAGIAVDLGGDAVVCPGYVINGVTAGAVAYVWNGDISVNTPSVSADSAGVYSLTVTDINGCTDADTISLALLPGPLVNLGPDQAACNQVVLNAGNPGAQYAWSVLGQSGQTLTATASGTYFVSVSASGCTDSDTIEVSILPGPSVDFGADSITCLDVVLDAGNPGSSYLWSTGATTQSITVSPSSTVSVLVSSANGCTDTDTLRVTPGVAPTVNLGPNGSICDELLLDAGNNGASYVWSTGASTQSIVATQTGSYSVTVTDAIGCESVDSIALVVSYSPDASFTTTFVSGLTYNFTNTTSAGGSYLWDFGDGTTSNLESPSHTFGSFGAYEVKLIVTNDCGSDTVSVILGNVSIQDEAFASLLTIYPNPSEGVFVVAGEGLFADQLTLEVMDLRGRLVSIQVLNNLYGGLNASVDLTNQAEGPYILKVSDGTRHAYFRIVHL